jgi:hypothetical protein
MRPELLAVRAVNQYRNRDILAYLGLRYYLENQCARRDRWITDIATQLVITRTSPSYFRSIHFKDFPDNKVNTRDIHIPSPNEALAEAALINECSKYESFQSLPSVYSYRFPDKNSKEGVYQRYFSGLQERHDSLANFCKNSNSTIIKYTDIKKFYPHITRELALQVWQKACEKSDIEPKYRELGEKLLSDHAIMPIDASNGKGLLTGPMISHLIANLVLHDVDEKMSAEMPNQYWRYVDDVILGGDKQKVKNGRKLLEILLKEKNLFLHDIESNKDFDVPSSDWLKGENDYKSTEHSNLWWYFISNIKRFLLINPEQKINLTQAFIENEININLPDYSNVVKESYYRERVTDWLLQYGGYKHNGWAVKKICSLSISGLINEAHYVRDVLHNEINILLASSPNGSYERKRLIPKLRYHAGQIAYLGTPDILRSVSEGLSLYPELHLLSTVMNTTESRDVSDLLSLGSNAVQSAAQILRLQNTPVKCSLEKFGDVESQGIAILQLNGIEINCQKPMELTRPLNSFASENNMQNLMKSDDLFIKELACLHGVDEPKRHLSLLNSAFDRDEDFAFDIINLAHYVS